MIRRAAGATATALIVVAVVGLVAWFVFQASTGASLVTFRTGSMSPSIPQGAVAVALPVPADELAVGDVITVQRGGAALPVTHRIVEISAVQHRPANAPDIRAAAPGSPPPDLTSPAARQVVMKGDDNASPDHLPYALTDAWRVVFSLPYVGTALTMMQTPVVMGALSILAAFLATWAFWPVDTIRSNPPPLSEHSVPRHARQVAR